MPWGLLTLGAGGHGRAVADLTQACVFSVAGFTDRPIPPGRPEVLGTDADLASLLGPHCIDGAVIGVGSTALGRRSELFRDLVATGVAVPALVHPRATRTSFCEVGDGSVVFRGSVLGSHVRVGVDVVLYSVVAAEHGSVIGDHA